MPITSCWFLRLHHRCAVCHLFCHLHVRCQIAAYIHVVPSPALANTYSPQLLDKQEEIHAHRQDQRGSRRQWHVHLYRLLTYTCIVWVCVEKDPVRVHSNRSEPQMDITTSSYWWGTLHVSSVLFCDPYHRAGSRNGVCGRGTAFVSSCPLEYSNAISSAKLPWVNSTSACCCCFLDIPYIYHINTIPFFQLFLCTNSGGFIRWLLAGEERGCAKGEMRGLAKKNRHLSLFDWHLLSSMVHGYFKSWGRRAWAHVNYHHSDFTLPMTVIVDVTRNMIHIKWIVFIFNTWTHLLHWLNNAQ